MATRGSVAYRDGGLVLETGVLWWLAPPAVVLGLVGGAIEGLTLRRSRGAGWLVAAVTGLFGLAVPAWFVDTFPWAPPDQQSIPSAALFTSWFGWALFAAMLTSVAVLLAGRPSASGATTDREGG